MTVPKNRNQICFIDFETTGVNVFEDEPIEFGAVLVNEQLEVIDTFYSRIKPSPGRAIREAAYKIHHITLDELADAPNQLEVLYNFFLKFGTDFRLAGWNIGFDITIFRRMCHENLMMDSYNKLNHRHIDVQSFNFLANQISLLPVKTNSLSDLVAFYHLNRSDSHSALEDAELTFQVYKRLLEDFKVSVTSAFRSSEDY